MSMWKKTLLPLALAVTVAGWGLAPAEGEAAPVVGNRPHRADGILITAPPAVPRPAPPSIVQPTVPKPAPPPSIVQPTVPKPALKEVYEQGDHAWLVLMAQTCLEDLGFRPGTRNGDFTRDTRKALKKFQKKERAEGLRQDGRLDMETYQLLKRRAAERKYGSELVSADSKSILATAARYQGTRYVFGGTTPKGFDCSGYVQYVFAQQGIRLTRTADTQAREGTFVPRSKLQPGDLVFFTTYAPGASHNGIYAGNGKFWNATSHGVMLSDLNDPYWNSRYYTGRHVLTGGKRP